MRVIAGTAGGQILKAPAKNSIRPTSSRVKEAVFNMLAARLEGVRFLDIFAGSGGVGIEALSRGAACCIFIEKDPAACRVIRDNLRQVRLADRAQLLPVDVFTGLRQLERQARIFQVAYADPPYGYIRWEKLLDLLAHGKLLVPGADLLVEVSKKEQPAIPASWPEYRRYDYGDSQIIWLRKEKEDGKRLADH